MASTFTDCIKLRHITCYNCSATYGLNEAFAARRIEDGKGWWCPYCGASTVFGDGENARLRLEKESLERQLRAESNRVASELARHDQTKARLRATKAVATRRKKQIERVEKGVCPQCKRSFTNLRRHMATQHYCGNAAQATPDVDALANKGRSKAEGR